jgi:hypothetical protein
MRNWKKNHGSKINGFGPTAMSHFEIVIREVAVERVGFSEKSQKSGDIKCPGHWGKSFVGLADAKQFLRIR